MLELIIYKDYLSLNIILNFSDLYKLGISFDTYVRITSCWYNMNILNSLKGGEIMET